MLDFSWSFLLFILCFVSSHSSINDTFPSLPPCVPPTVPPSIFYVDHFQIHEKIQISIFENENYFRRE